MKITLKKTLEAITLPVTYGFNKIHRNQEKPIYDVVSSRNWTVSKFTDFLIWFASTLGGGVAGVSLGGGIGTAIFPGVGTAIGAVAGGILGLMGGSTIGKTINTRTLPAFLTNLSLIGGGFYGALKGFTYGAMAGSTFIPIPGVGALIGGVLGGIAGGVVVGGFSSSVTAFTTKLLYQAGRAIFNLDAVNKTNPDKYQVAPPSEINDRADSMIYHQRGYAHKHSPSLISRLLHLGRKGKYFKEPLLDDMELPEYSPTSVSYGELKARNSMLETCLDWKKQNLGTWSVSKFFWTEGERRADRSLNSLIQEIHDMNNKSLVGDLSHVLGERYAGQQRLQERLTVIKGNIDNTYTPSMRM